MGALDGRRDIEASEWASDSSLFFSSSLSLPFHELLLKGILSAVPLLNIAEPLRLNNLQHLRAAPTCRAGLPTGISLDSCSMMKARASWSRLQGKCPFHNVRSGLPLLTIRCSPISTSTLPELLC